MSETIVERVCSTTGLTSQPQQGWMLFPVLRAGISFHETDAVLVEIRTGFPVNPYLWRHTYAAALGIGGTLEWPEDVVGEIWPHRGPEPLCLSKPWAELTVHQRLILSHGAMYILRPLDRLL